MKRSAMSQLEISPMAMSSPKTMATPVMAERQRMRGATRSASSLMAVDGPNEKAADACEGLRVLA